MVYIIRVKKTHAYAHALPRIQRKERERERNDEFLYEIVFVFGFNRVGLSVFSHFPRLFFINFVPSRFNFYTRL